MNVIKKKKWIPAKIEDAWAFFSKAENLSKITPAHMNFVIKSEDLPDEIYNGQIIEYTVSPVAGIPMQWVSEINHVDHLRSFVDIQLIGPYKLWHHKHCFSEVDGGTLVEDIVHFQLPLGVLGKMAYRLFVKSQLEGIFAHRDRMMEVIFSQKTEKEYVGT